MAGKTATVASTRELTERVAALEEKVQKLERKISRQNPMYRTSEYLNRVSA